MSNTALSNPYSAALIVTFPATCSAHPYSALVATFPADVQVAYRGHSVEFRLAGTRIAVTAELTRIADQCGNRFWLRALGPVKWGEEWVIHGTVRERQDT